MSEIEKNNKVKEIQQVIIELKNQPLSVRTKKTIQLLQQQIDEIINAKD